MSYSTTLAYGMSHRYLIPTPSRSPSFLAHVASSVSPVYLKAPLRDRIHHAISPAAKCGTQSSLFFYTASPEGGAVAETCHWAAAERPTGLRYKPEHIGRTPAFKTTCSRSPFPPFPSEEIHGYRHRERMWRTWHVFQREPCAP